MFRVACDKQKSDDSDLLAISGQVSLSPVRLGMFTAFVSVPRQSPAQQVVSPSCTEPLSASVQDAGVDASDTRVSSFRPITSPFESDSEVSSCSPVSQVTGESSQTRNTRVSQRFVYVSLPECAEDAENKEIIRAYLQQLLTAAKKPASSTVNRDIFLEIKDMLISLKKSVVSVDLMLWLISTADDQDRLSTADDRDSFSAEDDRDSFSAEDDRDSFSAEDDRGSFSAGLNALYPLCVASVVSLMQSALFIVTQEADLFYWFAKKIVTDMFRDMNYGAFVAWCSATDCKFLSIDQARAFDCLERPKDCWGGNISPY